MPTYWRAFTHGNGFTTDSIYDIHTDSGGSVYVTGTTGNAASNIFLYNGYLHPYKNLNSNTAFVCKLTADGDMYWRSFISNTATYANVISSNSVSVYDDPFVMSTSIAGSTTGVAKIFNSDNSDSGSSIPAQAGYVTTYDVNGTFKWKAYVRGTGVPDNATYLTIDSKNAGNVYVTGNTGSTAATIYDNLDTSIGTISNTYAAYLVKLSNTGSLHWKTTVDSSATGSSEIGQCVAVYEQTGDVYLTGSTGSGTLSNVYNSDETRAVNAGIPANSGYLLKFNQNGILQWRVYIGGSANESAFGVNIDTYGNPYVSGRTGTSACNFYNSNVYSNTFTGITAPLNSAYLAKYNQSGLFQWRSYIDSAAVNDVSRGVVVDAYSNVYVCGYNGNALGTIYNSNSTAVTSATIPTQSSYIVKYDPDGNYIWRNYIDTGGGVEFGYGVEIDPIYNDVYLVGSTGRITSAVCNIVNSSTNSNCFTGLTIPTNSSFVVKYNSNGNISETISNYTNGWRSYIANSTVNSITMTLDNNLFISGNTAGVLTTTGSNLAVVYDSNSLLKGISIPTNAVFLIKSDNTGKMTWRTYVDGFGVDTDSGVAYTYDYSYVYLSGSTGAATSLVFDANGEIKDTIPANSSFAVKYSIYDGSYLGKQYITNSRCVNISIDPFNDALMMCGNVYASTATIYSNSSGIAYGTTIPSNSAFFVTFRSNTDVRNIGYVYGTGNNTITYGTLWKGSTYIIGNVGRTNATIYDKNGATLTSLPAFSAFLVKYDDTGTFLWKSHMSNATTPLSSHLYCLSNPDNTSVLVCGATRTTTYSNILDTNDNLVANIAGQTGYILKYNFDGTFQWKTYMSGSAPTCTCLCFDQTGNYFYVAGVSNTITTTSCNIFNSNVYGFIPTSNLLLTSTLSPITAISASYIVKYSTNDGIAQWKSVIGTHTAPNSSTAATTIDSMSTDADNSLYVAGSGQNAGTISVFNSNGSASALTIPLNAGYVVKYKPNGNITF